MTVSVYALIHFCVCVYIYIYIVIYRQTVSLYHNSSVWLDTRDASSWDRNPADLMLVGHLTPQLSSSRCKQRNFKVYILCVCIYIYMYMRACRNRKHSWCNGYPHKKWTQQHNTATWVQILDKAICFLHSGNTLGNSIYPTIHSPAMDK